MKISHLRWSVRILTLLVLPIMIGAIPTTFAQEAYQTRNLSAIVYADGNVLVTHEADVDTTSPRVDIPLLGTSFQNILVVDQRGIPLDYSTVGNVLRIDTLGAYRVRISYQAGGLTSLSGDFRTFAIDAPAQLDVTISTGLISLSPTPLRIEQVDGVFSLTFPKGKVEVVYSISVAAPVPQPVPQPQPQPQPAPAPAPQQPAPQPQQPVPAPAPVAPAPEPQQPAPAPVPQPSPEPAEPKPEEQSQLTSPQNLLVIGVAIVALAIVGVFLTRRRK
ncbi:MAG: hypothetical protein HYY67_05070 [Thaumarchaeota archaeon]|nr:hypothetical protein [Nitrososphaerota archaeon]